ncbi:uncharacterized protein LOC126379160 [Pectinophora gossypiella]|uniref:uncharacterized protein LOC126372127 n=1 Tax=Pectinophora gossypiella TaxID=13191 RepID=UPI00214EA99D|nr:uncharacterized protein LOC126372127 [Pectinophora gossypiella]XP_049883772.1 uncharacterized protein LOC126379160 [Pectinophora gossypiella]
MTTENMKGGRRGQPDPESVPVVPNYSMMYDGIIPKFSGNDKMYTVSRWVEEIEDNGEIFNWTPIQKLIIARRSLCSTAELWLKSERVFKTFEDLKTAIMKEFSDTINQKELHEILSTKKKTNNETCYEYMLAMKELGRRGKLPDYITIQYIVDGIQDYENNKIMLYGVSTFGDLKEKLKIYEHVCKSVKQRHNATREQDNNTARRRQEDRRVKCYNCGEENHVSSQCPHRGKGLRCFQCGLFGHIALHCPKNPMVIAATATSGGSAKPLSQCDMSAKQVSERRPVQSAKQWCIKVSENGRNLDTNTGNTEMNENDVKNGVEFDRSHTGAYSQVMMINEEVNGRNRPLKSVQVNGKTVCALIDTGSEANLMSATCYEKLNIDKPEKCDVILSGFGASDVRSCDCFVTVVTIDGKYFTDVKFNIVPIHVMPYDMIIGQQLLQKTVMLLDHNKVTFLPSFDDSWSTKIKHFPAEVDFLGCEVKSNSIQYKVESLDTSYTPTKTRVSPTEMPVPRRLRRLTVMEQEEVELERLEWLGEEGVKVSTSNDANPLVLLRRKSSTNLWLLREENQNYMYNREKLKRKVKKLKRKEENKKNYDRIRKESTQERERAAKRTQFRSSMKLMPKLLEPCKSIKVRWRDCCDVEKMKKSDASADFMQVYPYGIG